MPTNWKNINKRRQARWDALDDIIASALANPHYDKRFREYRKKGFMRSRMVERAIKIAYRTPEIFYYRMSKL